MAVANCSNPGRLAVERVHAAGDVEVVAKSERPGVATASGELIDDDRDTRNGLAALPHDIRVTGDER